MIQTTVTRKLKNVSYVVFNIIYMHIYYIYIYIIYPTRYNIFFCTVFALS